MDGVCSPQGIKSLKESGTCLSRESLIRLANAWNKSHPDKKISHVATKTKKALWKDINIRMHPVCGKGVDAEACWVDSLKAGGKDIKDRFMPEMPLEWKKDSHTWLTNWDIENVMNQYKDEKSYHYEFLGVFPIDFGLEDAFGTCLYKEMCTVDLAKLRKKGIQYMGAIFNLDKHNQGGSHWTSLFITIDNTLPSYGAYYSDSVGREPPNEIKAFMGQLAAQAKVDKYPFQQTYNKLRQQYGNTECGMFSMAYQIRWLELLKKHPNTIFEKIVKRKMKDDDVHALRYALFRQGTKSEAPIHKKRVQEAKKLLFASN